MSEFRTPLGEEVFKQKYSANQYESWSDRAHVIVNSVCGDHDGTKNNLLSKDDRDQLVRYITKFQFLPGGRYIYYGGRRARMYNNCYLFKAEEDSREEWGKLWQDIGTSLNDRRWYWSRCFSAFRPSGRTLGQNGGRLVWTNSIPIRDE